MDYSSPESRYLTPEEVAKELRLNKRTVLKLAASGVIPSAKIGKSIRFDRDQIESLFAGSRS